MTKQVFVLGHRGMLGHVVARVFEAAGYGVCSSNARFDGDLDGGLLGEVRRSGCPIIVNCVGATPARSDPRLLGLANSLLPQALAAHCHGALLIHASTDGVFSGSRGGYAVDALTDARDPYGLSKRLGELCLAAGPAVVLRASIVGPEATPRSLLSWYLAQSGPVSGFVDQKWNGITTLSWARCALRAAQGELGFGIHQPACAVGVTKAELLAAIRAAFGAGPEILPAASVTPYDRTLEPTLRLESIQQQLEELKAWYENEGFDPHPHTQPPAVPRRGPEQCA